MVPAVLVLVVMVVAVMVEVDVEVEVVEVVGGLCVIADSGVHCCSRGSHADLGRCWRSHSPVRQLRISQKLRVSW